MEKGVRPQFVELVRDAYQNEKLDLAQLQDFVGTKHLMQVVFITDEEYASIINGK